MTLRVAHRQGRGLRRWAIYTLTDSEVTRATAIGLRRYQLNRQAMTEHRNWTAKSIEAHERDSVGAEIAFARLAGVVPRLLWADVHDWIGSTECTLPDGRDVDVKHTDLVDGRLLVYQKGSRLVSVVYVLMVGVFPTYHYAGWAAGEEVLAAEVTNPGRALCYTLKQHQLHRWLSL